MALTKQQKYLAGKIEKHVNKIISRGGGDEELLMSMADHMETYQRIMESTSQEELDELCHRYKGFYCFSKLLEAMAQGIQDGDISVP